MTNPIIISDIIIHKDEKGRYSLNDLHQAAGGERRHESRNWLNNQQTQELIEVIINTGISVFSPIESKRGCKGGTYVCKELVYAYATWISPEFFLKVLRAYDALISGEAKSSVPVCTPAQLIPLHQTADRLIATDPDTSYSDIWRLVHQRFDVENIHQLQPEQISEAVELLDALEGEYLERVSAPAMRQPQYHFPVETASPHDRRIGNALITPRVILDERNRAPELELLEALERDGHDVSGAKIRIYAMYDIARRLIDVQRELEKASHYAAIASNTISLQMQQHEHGINVSLTGKNKGMIYRGVCPRALSK